MPLGKRVAKKIWMRSQETDAARKKMLDTPVLGELGRLIPEQSFTHAILKQLVCRVDKDFGWE